MDPWYDILNGTNQEEQVVISDEENDGEEESTSEFSAVIRRLHRLLRTSGLIDAVENMNFDSPPASKEAVKNLKRTVIYEKTGEQCAICLREFGDDTVQSPEDLETIDPTQMTMPCSHQFHENCLNVWLGKTNSCPVCRYELPTDNPVYEEMRLMKKREKEREQNVQTLHNSMYS